VLARWRSWSRRRPLWALLVRRSAIGLVTLWAASLLVFLGTQVLPGNAAYAILGHTTTPARLHAVELQLGLTRSVPAQYWQWLSGVLSGHLGSSLANGQAVGSLVGPRLANSAFLVIVSGLIGTVIAVALGVLSAARRGGWLDHTVAVLALAATSLPEFVVGIGVVIVLATNVLHLFPGVAVLDPGQYAWERPRLVVLPVLTLVIIIVPYILRMSRAAMIEALESDFVEMGRLKGVPQRRLLLRYALPSATPPTIQVVGLTFLYLAGGIVIVEDVFAFPGVGQGLVNAVTDRDVPVIQFIVVVLATFYVMVNILTDVIALAASPRRRAPR